MNKAEYKAPAKVIITGEHSVVYGRPAVICAIDLWLHVVAEKKNTAGMDKKLAEVVEKIKSYLGKKYINEPCSIRVTSKIPIGRGLGSSAALCVAASAAVLHLLTQKKPSPEDINNCAYQAEKIFHSNASGADTSASCMGGIVYYRKEFEFLKNISSLQMKIPSAIGSKLLLIDSGKPDESTSEMVQAVGKLYNKKVSEMERTLFSMEKMTKRIVVSFAKEDSRFFESTIIANQKMLEKIGVVSKGTKQLLKKLMPYGTGKITGAGGKKTGSGYLLFFARDLKGLYAYLTKNNISYLSFNPSGEGVKQIT